MMELLISDPDPLQIIQDTKFAKQDGWRLDDISLCSSGYIAVSGHQGRPYKTYVCIYDSNVDNSDTRDKPTLLYHKQFTHWLEWWPHYVSFIKPNSTEIVTCWNNRVQVIDYDRDVVLRSREVNGETTCLSASGSQIFIGLRWSNFVNIYDNDLNEIKSIRLSAMQEDDYPWDIVAVADRLYVRSYSGAFVSSQDNGRTLGGFFTMRPNCRAFSIAVNIQLELTAVLWSEYDTKQKHIVFYLPSENKVCLYVNVESGVSRIRISGKGTIVTGNEYTGEVKIYNLASFFSYGQMKEILVCILGNDDCEKVADFFALGGEVLNSILNSARPASALLLALEEKGIIQPSNVDRLEEAFLKLNMNVSFYNATNMYQKLMDQITSYDRFLATISAHLTSSLPAELCDYFHVSGEQKDSILSSQNPGLSLLLVLDEMGVIEQSEVGCLEEPFHKLRLVQALAKIDEYKEILKEENGQVPQPTPHSLEDKRTLFVEFLKKKVKSWYESMTPVPWKKSCQWKATDLFIGSGLILTDSKAKQNVQNIDEQCKLNYSEIFTHEKLKSEIRIILEGDPGAGKTILSSQLAYDWSEGKIDGVDILIFLPLKIVEDKTLIQAVKGFYIPANTPLSCDDIECILASDTERICFVLDGLEEYSTGGRMRLKESSEVMKIIKKEKHSNCKVVITCRSDFAHDLPKCPMLKLGRFGETERNSYIEKILPNSTDKQQKIKRIIQDNPFILDLCRVPLLFVLAVHNIESLSLSKEGQLNRVSPFMRSMILKLCSSSSVKHEVDGMPSKSFEREKMTSLGELAFNGLCKEHQQLSWQKDFVESNVDHLKDWVDSGILILEEGLVITEKENQDISKINEGEKVNEKAEETVGGFASQISKFLYRVIQKIIGNTEEEERKGTDELPVLCEDTKTASVGVSKVGQEVSKIKKQHRSVSQLETEPHVKKTVRRVVGQVPLTVKFLHKVIQEWFAATFFCTMMGRCPRKDQFQNYVSRQLQHISPTDLHYLLRFTSYLHPLSCPVIMNYLLRSYSTKGGSVPLYIMNCIFLCFNEHNDIKGSDMREIVIDVCKEVITIQSEDSRILQQAKCALLEYASHNGVIIEKLELEDVIFAVDETSLTLNSGVKLGIMHTVKLIKVSRWDHILQEDDYRNILKLLTAGTLLKELCCIFPSQPPDSLNEKTLENVLTKDLKVEWHIGHLVQSLDPRGKWMVNFKQPTSASTEIFEVSAEQATLSVESTITNDGGSLKIAGTDVQLIVPPGAFKEDRNACFIKLRIIPPGRHDEASTSFCSNSSTIVELLPNNLELTLPVKLTLPHCLQLKKGFQNKVKIFMSHHEGGAQPRWEEEFAHLYLLDDTKCTIWMKRFCWMTYEIDDEIVEAKKIQIYTAAKPIYVPDDIAEIHVGFHLDLPGAGEILRQNPSFILYQRMPYLFLRKGKHPLMVFLASTLPSTWTYSTPEDNPQEIPFRNVASSVEYSCPFILQHDADTTKVPTCIFKASQSEHELKLNVRPKVVTSQTQPSSIHSKAEIHHQENVTTQAEGNSENSKQLKGSQQDAAFQLPDAIPWGTPDAAVRRKLPLQENQHERDCYTRNKLEPLRQPQGPGQDVIQTHGQISPHHQHQMLPNSGLPSQVPPNSFIQQNYHYHQNFSISPYGAPFVGGQCLYEFSDQANRGGVTLGYSFTKKIGKKIRST